MSVRVDTFGLRKRSTRLLKDPILLVKVSVRLILSQNWFHTTKINPDFKVGITWYFLFKPQRNLQQKVVKRKDRSQLPHPGILRRATRTAHSPSGPAVPAQAKRRRRRNPTQHSEPGSPRNNARHRPLAEIHYLTSSRTIPSVLRTPVLRWRYDRDHETLDGQFW